MARKKISDIDMEDVEMDFNPETSLDKLPVDISGGKKALMEYMEIPVDDIDPFGNKLGSDFTEYDDNLSSSMLESIKQYGVMEAITVRPKQGGRYELLVGEHRWRYAKLAGLKKIPAHVINVDNTVADAYFSLTNILRRPVSLKDLIYGWWRFYISLKDSGNLSAFRNAENPSSMAPQLGGDSKALSYRQMMRYVKMNDLTDDWISLIDAGQSTSRVGVVIANLPQKRQQELLDKAPLINEENAKNLVLLNEGTFQGPDGTVLAWTNESISLILSATQRVTKKKPAKPVNKAFKAVQPKVIKAVESYLRPDDYSRAEEVIQKALELYYADTK